MDGLDNRTKVKREKGNYEKGTMGQRDKWIKRQRNKGTMGPRDVRTIYIMYSV